MGDDRRNGARISVTDDKSSRPSFDHNGASPVNQENEIQAVSP